MKPNRSTRQPNQKPIRKSPSQSKNAFTTLNLEKSAMLAKLPILYSTNIKLNNYEIQSSNQSFDLKLIDNKVEDMKLLQQNLQNLKNYKLYGNEEMKKKEQEK